MNIASIVSWLTIIGLILMLISGMLLIGTKWKKGIIQHTTLIILSLCLTAITSLGVIEIMWNL